MTPHPLVLICSVSLEAAPLQALLRDPEPIRVGGKAGTRGLLGSRPVLLLAAGMGKTNAAHGLTALLERSPVAGVIGFGVGGAYSGAGLELGAVVVASREVYGDEGVAAMEGWISTEGIGIPLLERAGERRFNEFPLEPARVAAAAAAAGSGAPAVVGPFVTVSCCSGTRSRGDQLAARFGAICESMEGAAYAHIAALYGAPFVEVRGISNQVEDRDLSRWRLHAAAEAAAAAAARIALQWHSQEA